MIYRSYIYNIKNLTIKNDIINRTVKIYCIIDIIIINIWTQSIWRIGYIVGLIYEIYITRMNYDDSKSGNLFWLLCAFGYFIIPRSRGVLSALRTVHHQIADTGEPLVCNFLLSIYFLIPLNRYYNDKLICHP